MLFINVLFVIYIVCLSLYVSVYTLRKQWWVWTFKMRWAVMKWDTSKTQ